jgi:hypothetical protein
MKGVIVKVPPPHMMTGAEVQAQVDVLVLKEGECHFVGYGVQHAWSQKLGLWRLPYMKDLHLSHNIDVMQPKRMLPRHYGVQSWTYQRRVRTMLRLESI